MTLQLYRAQSIGVGRFLGTPDNRLILAYGTGVGKTPTAITALSHLGARRILVACPAIVRRHWVREFARWAELEAHAIEMGRDRKTGTKKALAARDAAYQASIQVVSYDLLPQCDRPEWDAVVFDEIHHLGDPLSKQSEAAADVMEANPGVPALGLSATLIPTEVKQLWHPLNLFWPGEWGAPARTGDISWDFQFRYCNIEKNAYGTRSFGARADRLDELRGRLAGVTHRVTRADIANDLPPLDVSLLEVAGSPRTPMATVEEWLKALEADISHACVLVYHRELAIAIAERAKALFPNAHVAHIDGSIPAGKRDEILQKAEAAPRAFLIGTSEALREGIRLMWVQKTLFAEWRTAPAQVIQVLGRFQSVGDPRRPIVQVLADESSYSASQTLVERVGHINALLKAGAAEQVVQEVFAPRELSEARLSELTKNMLLNYVPKDDWQDDDDNDSKW